MSDVIEDMELSELERLEFNRRNDVAYAVIPLAVKAFTDKAELDERIKAESKALSSNWRWVVLVGGLVLHYFIVGNTWAFSWGLGISLGSILGWYIKKHELDQLGAKRNVCNDKLHALQVIWDGATGRGSFWDIVRFAGENGFDNRDEAFCDWWADQTKTILERVCGLEKGERIGDAWASRQARFRASLNELQTNQ